MKSWQKGLKISITHLNGRDVALKLFSPSVVWQGSLILNEVLYFNKLFFDLHAISPFSVNVNKIKIDKIEKNKIYFVKHFAVCCIFRIFCYFQDHSRMKLPGFSLCSEKSKKNNKLHVNRFVNTVLSCTFLKLILKVTVHL